MILRRLQIGQRIRHAILFGLRVLHGNRNAEQPLAGQAERQRHRFRVFELNVRNALEAFGFVACDQTDVAHFADAAEELLQVASANALRQLHAEDGSSVALLGTEIFGWRSIAEPVGRRSAATERTWRWGTMPDERQIGATRN